MEENVQRVFSIIIAVIIFFLLPMYVAFEKKDDVAYALAVKITSELVENVKNNGYISRKMYEDYVSKLGITNNTYEIKMEHKSYKYNPIIYSYTDTTYKKIRETFDYGIYKNEYKLGSISYKGNTYGNLILSYAKNEEVYTESQILDVLSRDNSGIYTGMSKEAYANIKINDIPLEPNLYTSGALGAIYTMNKGDQFTVRIKNVNTTTAEIFFNALTVGMVTEPIPRVYVNYGSTILAEKYKNWVVANSGYTGNVQEITIAETGNYLLEVWGASGSGNNPDNLNLASRGGKGGYAKGQKYFTKGTRIYAYVGGQGAGDKGGFNGGGNAGPKANGGGGATDIRIIGGAWNDNLSLNSRIIVAGGGGGADDVLTNELPGSLNDGSGGDGGGTNGSKGYINGSLAIRGVDPIPEYNNIQCANGGAQYAFNGLKLGYAENAIFYNDLGGGGGGYYGGAPSKHYNGGGGGGSGFIGGVANGQMQSGTNTGNGMFRITFIN
ncbi:MAG: glycine-rich protein [Clostridia bacterium]